MSTVHVCVCLAAWLSLLCLVPTNSNSIVSCRSSLKTCTGGNCAVDRICKLDSVSCHDTSRLMAAHGSLLFASRVVDDSFIISLEPFFYFSFTTTRYQCLNPHSNKERVGSLSIVCHQCSVKQEDARSYRRAPGSSKWLFKDCSPSFDCRFWETTPTFTVTFQRRARISCQCFPCSLLQIPCDPRRTRPPCTYMSLHTLLQHVFRSLPCKSPFSILPPDCSSYDRGRNRRHNMFHSCQALRPGVSLVIQG